MLSELAKGLILVLRRIRRVLRVRYWWWRLRQGIGPIRCIVRGTPIQINAKSSTEYWRAYSYEWKEPDTLDWIDRYVKRGDVFYDIGANIGLYALYAAKKAGAQVYAFEPEARNFAALCENIALNNLKVMAYPVAVADHTGPSEIYLHSLERGSALHAVGSPIDYEGRSFVPAQTQGVYSVRLDALDLPRPKHVKLDVDGLEAKVLNGMRGVWDSVETMLVEIDERDQLAARDLVARMGLTIVAFRPVGTGQNVLAVRSDRAGDTGPTYV